MGFFSYAIKKILFYQSQFPDVDDNEIKEMDIRITKLTELVQSKQEENRKLDTGEESFIINMYISNLMYFNLGTVKVKRF
jgi:AMMECR1 domain-containing protein